MILYLSVIAVLSFIGIICLKRKMSLGIIPIVIVSSIVAGVVCIAYSTSEFYKTLDSHEINIDTISTPAKDSIYAPCGDIAIATAGENYSIDDLTSVKISNVKVPTVQVVIKRRRADLGLAYDIGYNKTLATNLVLNKKDYGIFKAYKDSLEKGR